MTRLGELEAARDWQMLVDVGQWLTVPPEIAITNLRSDLVLWSKHTAQGILGGAHSSLVECCVGSLFKEKICDTPNLQQRLNNKAGALKSAR